MSFKEVFIEPRERWHRAIAHRTKQQAADNNHETEKTANTAPHSSLKGLNADGQKVPSQIFSRFALCPFLPKLKWPAAARPTSIVNKPHSTLLLLQGIIHSH